ncbi:hypothetical protein ACIO13_21900 [Streptomyces sp. NPDC087425]|uniref:hypothetical protein n=1 Tax=Streptomyces sp. NPDC087425 TaxID=3365787 RepID=UPI0037F6BA88
MGELDGDQDQAVADLPQQGPAADVFGVAVLAGRGDDGGFGGGQASAALAAVRVQGGGQPVEGAVDTAGEGEPGVCVGTGEVGDAEPERERLAAREVNSLGPVAAARQPAENLTAISPGRMEKLSDFRARPPS